MPQSHVSETVARLREQGTVEPFPTPATAAGPWCGSARGTQVTSCGPHMVPADAALTAALGDLSPDEAADIIETLEALAARPPPRQTRSRP